MNAYFCDAGDRPYVEEVIAGSPRYEIERVFGLVVAESRGKAKALLAAKADVPYTEIRSSLQAEGVEHAAGLVPPGDPLWEVVDWGCLDETPETAVQP